MPNNRVEATRRTARLTRNVRGTSDRQRDVYVDGAYEYVETMSSTGSGSKRAPDPE